MRNKAFLENASKPVAVAYGQKVGLCPTSACSFSLKGKGHCKEHEAVLINNGILVDGAVLLIAEI